MARQEAYTERNQQIVQLLYNGKTTREVAALMGISAARVSQINRAWQSQFTDDDVRDAHRSLLEGYLTQLQPLIFGRGRLMVAPNGKTITDPDTGDPLYDPYVKTDAIRTGMQLMERIARSYALDKPKQKNDDVDREFAEAMKWVEQLAAENRRLAGENTRMRARQLEASPDVVEAEVVEDQGSGGSLSTSPSAHSMPSATPCSNVMPGYAARPASTCSCAMFSTSSISASVRLIS